MRTPYHICTKGQEDRIVFHDDDDFRAAQNSIAVCSRRSGVSVLAFCLLHTHFHIVILAESRIDAGKFAESLKISNSRHLTAKYGESLRLFRNVDVNVIPIETRRYLRDCIAYVLKNSLDLGVPVDVYKWSSFRSLFRGGACSGETSPVNTMNYREIRKAFGTSDNLREVPWRINHEGVVEPVSFCEWKTVEDIFCNDISFFLRCLGLVDNKVMKEKLVNNPLRSWTTEDLLVEINDTSHRRYDRDARGLTYPQKIQVLKSVHYSTGATAAQLARCLNLKREFVEEVLAHC